MKRVEIEIIEPKALNLLRTLEGLKLISIRDDNYVKYEKDGTAPAGAKESQEAYTSAINHLTKEKLADWLTDLRGRFDDFAEEEIKAEIEAARQERNGSNK